MFSNSISISGQRANAFSMLSYLLLYDKLLLTFVVVVADFSVDDVDELASMEISELAAVEQQFMAKAPPPPQSVALPMVAFPVPHPLKGFISFMTVMVEREKYFYNLKKMEKRRKRWKIELLVCNFTLCLLLLWRDNEIGI